MQCPECGNPRTFVDTTRQFTPVDDLPYISRDRRCPECRYRFTTQEVWTDLRMNKETGALIHSK